MNRPFATLLLLLAAAPLAQATDAPTPRFRLVEAQLRSEPVSADGRFRVGPLRVIDSVPGSATTSRFTIKSATPSKALCNPVPPPAIFGNGFEDP